MKKIIFLAIVLLSVLFIYVMKQQKLVYVKDYDISAFKYNLLDNYPTVDIVIIHSEQVEASWNDLIQDFKVAYNTFKKYGIQLNLVRAINVKYPSSWNGILIDEHQREPVGNLDFYERMDYVAESIPKESEKILTSFINLAEQPGRTIYVVTISDIIVSWYEKDQNDKWKKVSSATSAVSFPNYNYADRIPEKIRGLITLERTKPLHKTLSHELGHKLINVSHEGGKSCPKGDGNSIPGLMGYGDSLEILSGLEGRWHLERLLLSPFIYRIVDGKKIWNKDFEKGGVYNDPIYGSYIMKPACPL